MPGLADWLDHHMMPCFFKQALGFDCPGCGSQRAFASLLRGHVIDSFWFYPALIPMIAMFVLLALHLYFKFEKGGTWLKYIFIANAALIFVNFTVKLIIHHP
jgi:hypothetical protein